MDLSSWLLVFCGAVMLVVLVDIVMPLGKMSSYVKTFSVLLVFFVIVSPIINFFKDFDTDDLEAGWEINQSIVGSVATRQIENSINLFQKKIKDELGLDCIVEIDYYMSDSSVVIETVYIYTSNAGISENNKNINITDSVVLLAQSYFNIDSTQVIVYE